MKKCLQLCQLEWGPLVDSTFLLLSQNHNWTEVRSLTKPMRIQGLKQLLQCSFCVLGSLSCINVNICPRQISKETYLNNNAATTIGGMVLQSNMCQLYIINSILIKTSVVGFCSSFRVTNGHLVASLTKSSFTPHMHGN